MKINNLASQKALTYCIYMMVSGNFAGCRMVNPCMEKKMLLELKGQKLETQERFENAAAQLADQFFLRKLPASIWKEQPKASISINEENGLADIVFTGKKWKLRIVGLTRGKKKPKFFYNFSESFSCKTTQANRAA